MDGFATFEVTLAGLGGEVATGAERGRYKNYSNMQQKKKKIIAITFVVNPPSFSILYLGCYHDTYFL